MRLNICLLLTSALLACYFTECNADPSVYVKIEFSFTWSEMCNLGDFLKQSIGKQIVMDDKTGRTLPTDQIVLYNFDDYCPKGAYKKANVYVFASKIAGSKSISDIDEKMTKKIYEILQYLLENKLERYLGSLFVGKIESVDIAGKNAPEKSTAYTEIERLYIGLGVGLIIIILILVISVIIVYCRNRNTSKNEDRYSGNRYRAGNENVEVRTYPEPSANRNDGFNDGEDPNGLQTKF